MMEKRKGLQLGKGQKCWAQAAPAVRVLQGYGCSVDLDVLGAGVVRLLQGYGIPL